VAQLHYLYWSWWGHDSYNRYCLFFTSKVTRVTFYSKMYKWLLLIILSSSWRSLYTTTPASTMNVVVLRRSSTSPYSFCWIVASCGASRSWSYRLHLWRMCSAVWSSSPQGHIGDGTNLYFLHMCAFSLLCPECSLTITTCSGLFSMW